MTKKIITKEIQDKVFTYTFSNDVAEHINKLIVIDNDLNEVLIDIQIELHNFISSFNNNYEYVSEFCEWLDKKNGVKIEWWSMSASEVLKACDMYTFETMKNNWFDDNIERLLGNNDTYIAFVETIDIVNRLINEYK